MKRALVAVALLVVVLASVGVVWAFAPRLIGPPVHGDSFPTEILIAAPTVTGGDALIVPGGVSLYGPANYTISFRIIPMPAGRPSVGPFAPILRYSAPSRAIGFSASCSYLFRENHSCDAGAMTLDGLETASVTAILSVGRDNIDGVYELFFWGEWVSSSRLTIQIHPGGIA